MGQNPATKYTEEFRRETADYIISSGRPITECCKELGLNSKTVNTWVVKRRRELGGRRRPDRGPRRRAQAAQEEGARAGDGERVPEKSRGLLRQDPGVAERYLLMEAERADYPIGMIARLLGVSRSGFYDWLKRGRSDPWADARDAVMACWEASGGRFGARTVRVRLAARGMGLTLHRVRKLMRELGIRGVVQNARKVTTVPDPGAPGRPDLVRRRFRPPVPSTVLVGDITYPRTGRGWLYLAAVIDLATRMVVGWSMSERMTAGLAVAALEAAWARGYVAGGAIFHSDRGAQCTSRLMAERAEGHDVRLSVGRTGSCHDDAVAESFFATLKNEMYSLRPWATRAEARHAVVGFIETCYNRRRPHSTIGYQVPAERMAAFMERAERAFSEDEGAMPMAA